MSVFGGLCVCADVIVEPIRLVGGILDGVRLCLVRSILFLGGWTNPNPQFLG